MYPCKFCMQSDLGIIQGQSNCRISLTNLAKMHIATYRNGIKPGLHTQLAPAEHAKLFTFLWWDSREHVTINHCNDAYDRLRDKTSETHLSFSLSSVILISNAGSTPYRPRLSFGDGDLETESDDSDSEADVSVQDHDMQSLVPILERTIGELHNAAKSQDDEDNLKSLSGRVGAKRSRYGFYCSTVSLRCATNNKGQQTTFSLHEVKWVMVYEQAHLYMRPSLFREYMLDQYLTMQYYSLSVG